MNDDRTSFSWLVLLALWATFLTYSVIAAPIPGVNETHYLCKAKHFWQPTWCAPDFFLASANAHTVFYATIGALTVFLSLEQTAWVGRGIAYLLLAYGWTRGVSHMCVTKWTPLWTAWIFLAFASCGNFSGEWLVGGVEGKVFTYAFLFMAFADFLESRQRRAAVWAGIAVSFHPVVGIWALLAFAASQAVLSIVRNKRAHQVSIRMDFSSEQQRSLTIPGPVLRGRPILKWIGSLDPIVLTMVFVFSLPGLIPVVQLLIEPAPEQTRYAATYLQVYFRLAHHLDPMTFSQRAYLGYALLIAIWVGNLYWQGRTNAKRAFDNIVLWAIVFAVIGIAVGFGPRPPARMFWFDKRMNLLKFYPYRLADILIPLSVAVSVAGVFERTLLTAPLRLGRRFSLPQATMVLLFLASLWRAHSISELNRYARVDRADWLDVCRWINDHTPADALFQSPTNSWAFKWFAQRAEYVTYKDCPQDAAGLVEWNRRLNFLKNWYEKQYADGLYSTEELRELRRQTKLSHLLTDRLGPLELEATYRNKTFQVYDLTSLDE